MVWDSGGRPAYAETTVIANTPQCTWRQSYFETPKNSGDAADDFDYDQDGLANLAEYAFGLDPTSDLFRQAPQPEWTGSGFTVSFTTPGGVSDVTYGAEWSTTLQPGSWTSIADTGTAQQHTFTIPAGSSNRLFVRLRVTSS